MPGITVIAGDSFKEYAVPDGTTPLSFMRELYPETGNFPLPAICVYQGKPVLRAQWGEIALHGEAKAAFALVPRVGNKDGGSNPMAMLMTVAIMIAAAYSGPAASAAAVNAGAVTAGTLGATAVSVGVSIAVGMSLTMLANKIGLLPSTSAGQQEAIQNEAASPTYSINASGNMARLFQPEPELFGRMQIVADIVAKAWAQYIENDMYLYQVFGLGRGVSEQESMSFGGVKFWENGEVIDSALGTDIEVQIVEPGGRVTLFPDNVETSADVASQELLAPNQENAGWFGPFPVCPPGAKVNSILIDLYFPNGLGKFNELTGKLENYEVGWEFQYQILTDGGAAGGDWMPLNAGSRKMATQTPQRLTLKLEVADMRYQVRGRRTTDSADGTTTLEVLQWLSLRGMLPGTLRYNQTVVAVKIKASNTISSQASQQFTVIQTRKLPLWNQALKLWTEPVPTRSFAAAIAWAAKAELGGRLKDSQIDLDGLWAIDAEIEKRGWHCDAWIDGPYSIAGLITEMCAAACIIPQFGSPVLSFVLDAKPNRPVKHVFTPYNIVRGSFQPTYNTFTDQTPDDVCVSYLDEEAGFARRDVTAILPDSESKEPNQQQPLFIVNRRHAHAIGVYMAACNRYRRTGCVLQSGPIGRILNKGDVVSVNHPRLSDLASGKLVNWNEAELLLQLDPIPELPENMTTIYMTFARPNGSPWGPVKIAGINNGYAQIDISDYTSRLLSGEEVPFAWFTRGYDRMPTIWTLQGGRNFERRMIIQSIVPQDQYTYSFNLVNDDMRMYDLNIPVPEWQYRQTLPSIAMLDKPQYLTVEETGTADDPILVFSWMPVAGADGYDVSYSPDNRNWTRIGRFNRNTSTFSIEPGGYYLRVYAYNDHAQSSNASTFGLWNDPNESDPGEEETV
jgi:hypothetical protein